MSNQNAKGKLKYEAPALVALGEMGKGLGACSGGSSAATSCSTGSGVNGYCTSVGSVTIGPPGYCTAGTTATGGYCTSNGTTAGAACTTNGATAGAACSATGSIPV